MSEGRTGNAHLSVLGRGAYTLETVSHLLGVTERTIVAWGTPTARRPRPLVEPEHGWAYSFHNLVSLAVVAVFRQRGVQERSVLRALDVLKQRHQAPEPFARQDLVERLSTAGSSIIFDDLDIGEGLQAVLLPTLRTYLRPIQYDEDSKLAKLWAPTHHVLVDPAIQVGWPCVKGTRVTTDVVASRLDQGEPLSVVARDLRLTTDQAVDAQEFEASLDEGVGLAALPHAA